MPNELNEQRNRNLNEIKTAQKARMVNDASVHRSLESYSDMDRETVVRENDALMEVLNEDSIWTKDDASAYRDKNILRNRLTRNYAGLVIGDTKWYGGGSPEMIRVQDQARELFGLLDQPIVAGQERTAQMAALVSHFDEAISACRNYEAKKNPWFSTGKRRKEQVTNLRRELERQKSVFEDGLALLMQGKLDHMTITTPQDLLMHPYSDQMEEVEREAAGREVIRSDFEDFQPYDQEQANSFFAVEDAGLGLKSVQREEAIQRLNTARQNRNVIAVPKYRKSLAERRGVAALGPVLRKRKEENEAGQNYDLKAYMGDNPAEKIKNDLKSAKEQRKQIIEGALQQPEYSYYVNLKSNPESAVDQKRLGDPALLSLLIKSGEENKEHNKKVLEAVFTKGITTDNLRMEKLRPYLNDLVYEFLGTVISSAMLDDANLANYAVQLTRFVKLAAFLRSISAGHKVISEGNEQEFESPFQKYYVNNFPPALREIVDQRIKAAMPLFQLLKDKLQSFGIKDEDMDFEELHQDFKNCDPSELKKNWDRLSEEEKHGKTDKEWRSDLLDKAATDWETNEKEFADKAGSFVDAKIRADKIVYAKEYNRKFGAQLYYYSESETMRAVQGRLFRNRDEHVDMSLQEANAIEHVFEIIVNATLSSKDFSDPMSMMIPSRYAANKQLINLAEKISGKDKDLVRAYRVAMKKKQITFNLSEDDILMVEGKIKDIKKAAGLYSELEKITDDPMFDMDEFVSITTKMSLEEAKRLISGYADDSKKSSAMAYYNSILRFHKDAVGKDSAGQGKEYIEKYYLTENEKLTRDISAFDGKNDVASRFEKANIIRNINRNQITVLLNDKRENKEDSTEMDAVKKALKKLDEKLHAPLEGSGIDAVITAYNTAIGAMEAYENSKNPWFSEGKRRLRRVTELKDALKDELQRITSQNQAAVNNGRYIDGVNCANDLLLGLAKQQAESAADRFAVKNAAMFAKIEFKTGTLPEGIKNIRDAYREMIMALNTDILKVKDAIDDNYDKQKRAIEKKISDVIKKCDTFMAGKNLLTKGEISGENFDSIESFRNRIIRLDELVSAKSDAVATGMAKGTTYMDVVGAVLDGMEKADAFENSLQGVKNAAMSGENVQNLLTVVRGVFTVVASNKDQSRYAEFDQCIGKEVQDVSTSNKFLDGLIKHRCDACIELSDAFDRQVKNPVPREFLKDDKDDPMDEKLRKEFAYLMLTQHPAYVKIQEADAFSSLIVSHTQAEAVKFHQRSNEYAQRLDKGAYKKLETGGDIALKIDAAGSSDLLKKEAVDRYVNIVKEADVAKAKDELAKYADKKYLGYREDELEENGKQLEREEKRIQELINKEKKVQEIKNRKLQAKKDNAAAVSNAKDVVLTRHINLQNGLDINIAKKTDFKTVEALSVFADKMDTEAFAAYVKSYTGAGLEKEDAKRARHEFINRLTDEILGMDPASFDISSDTKIAKSAAEFELLSAKLSAFKTILGKNPDFEKELSRTEEGKARMDRIREKIHVLGDISRYYRIRKLIITNPLFQSFVANEISLDETSKDDFETKYLKKLHIYLNDLSDKIEKSEGVQITKEQAALDEAMEKELMALEYERLFVPTASMKLTIKNIPDSNKEKMFAHGLASKAETEMMIMKSLIDSDPKMKEIYDGINKYKKEEIKGNAFQNAVFPKAATFDGKTVFSDSIDRQIHILATVFSYGQTPAEILQVLRHITVKQNKKYDENDKEALAYYESAFIDGIVKFQSYLYALVMRNVNAFGVLPFILHPKDAALQFTPQMRANIMAGCGVTNFLTPDNMRRYLDFMKKHNTTGKYPIDYDDYADLGNGYSQFPLKINRYLTDVYLSAMDDDGKFLPKGTKAGYAEWCARQTDPKIQKYVEQNKPAPIEYFASYLFEEHGDWLTSKEFFEQKDPDGNYLFNDEMAIAELTFLTGDLKPMYALLNHAKIQQLSKEEIDAYEERLKKLKYFSIGSKDDPYLIGKFRKKFIDFMFDKDGNPHNEGMPLYIQQNYSEEDQQKFIK